MRLFAMIVVLLGQSAALSAAGPFEGTWKFDRAKSSGSVPKDETVVIERKGTTLSVAISIVLPDGRTLLLRYSAPLKGGLGHIEDGPYNGVSVRRIDSHVMDIAYLADGKTVRSTRSIVAPDGKTMTSTGKAADPASPTEWTMVFQKQPPARR